jgi:hypothetical protein
MCFKQYVAQNTRPVSAWCSVEFNRAKQSRCFTIRSSFCINRSGVGLANNNWIISQLSIPPALFLGLNKPLSELKRPIWHFIRLVNIKRTLWCHFRNELGLCLAFACVGSLKLTRLIYETKVGCRLQRSSGSSWYYMHTNSVYAILLPEHA